MCRLRNKNAFITTVMGVLLIISISGCGREHKSEDKYLSVVELNLSDYDEKSDNLGADGEINVYYNTSDEELPKKTQPEISGECDNVKEAEAKSGFKIALPEMKGYKLSNVYYDCIEGGFDKSISVSYKKNDSTFGMTVHNMKGSNGWDASIEKPGEQTKRHDYVNSAGYTITENITAEDNGNTNIQAIILFQNYYVMIWCDQVEQDIFEGIMDTIDYSIYGGKNE